MNLPELITKLLIIERDLIQQGIEVNELKVSYFSEYCDPIVTDIQVEDNLIRLI
jgi:hypothetical protein